ncbi:MAG: YbhB/YbcL family Raf kinase inhibitor-like protein [Candidatus Niyogibacteria bacterium]|nr:YbhB/YbcL family Raf kinase inhibitor-like protein [Candidatus Niyogibacteria bacterium]
MKLTSPAFEHNGKIPPKYTCDGDDVSPPLLISDVPQKAKSLVLIMDDPDAIKPAGKIWDHWIVWNIPPDTKEIHEGKEPKGVYGMGTSKNLGYQGPCPPDDEHRYYFQLYALDTELTLSYGSIKADVESAIQGHILTQTELIGLYTRK